uniref:Putative secreted peptide n=1 Tax=Anopheles braziliensis TaxID=58242 RepID=A0A2M3ZT99_9DIPT
MRHSHGHRSDVVISIVVLVTSGTLAGAKVMSKRVLMIGRLQRDHMSAWVDMSHSCSGATWIRHRWLRMMYMMLLRV